MKNSLRLVALAFAFAATCAAAQVFKWVDENGRTQYGSQPPPGVKATPMNVTPPAPEANQSEPEWKKKDLDFQRRKIERDKKESEEAEKNAKRAARLPRECAHATEELRYLERGTPVYDFDKQGNKVYLEDTERTKRIAQARAFIADSCR